jgi:sulfur carrier protein
VVGPIPYLLHPRVTIFVNGQPREMPTQTTVAALLQQLAVPPRGVAVEVNLDIVPRVRHAETTLADGDRVEVVTLVGGG